MMLISLSFIILHLSFSRVAAQDVSVTVNPVQQVLPPQAGQYVDNPGKFFNVRVVNNTDERQLLYFGMHIDMLFPEEQRMVATPTDNRHIPRQPITLEPRASKVLNPVEMKLLFSHYELTEIYIRDGMYNDYKRGIFGLMPEGQFRLYMHAYKWNPELTTAVPLNLPEDGQCQFTICYTAQAPKFISPQPAPDSDPLGSLSVAKVDMNLPQFTWIAPTLNCNLTLFSFTYDVKVVRLDNLTPDEAIEKNPVVFERNKLTTPMLTIPAPYVARLMEDPKAVYAMQVTANTGYGGRNSLNFTLVENEGRSEVLLFRLFDPTKKDVDEEIYKTEKNSPSSPSTTARPTSTSSTRFTSSSSPPSPSPSSPRTPAARYSLATTLKWSGARPGSAAGAASARTLSSSTIAMPSIKATPPTT